MSLLIQNNILAYLTKIIQCFITHFIYVILSVKINALKLHADNKNTKFIYHWVCQPQENLRVADDTKLINTKGESKRMQKIRK